MVQKLLKEVKNWDYEYKRELIAQIETFKAIHKKNENIKTKEIVIALTKELEEVNNRIDRIKEISK